MSETAYDKYPFFGEWTFDYSPPEAWEPLLDALCALIADKMKWRGLAPELLQVVQVKEKLGGLRFYCQFKEELYDDPVGGYIDGAVSLAELMSFNIK